ncbi:unnamed protein product, partial [Durusdinium trenchii]
TSNPRERGRCRRARRAAAAARSGLGGAEQGAGMLVSVVEDVEDPRELELQEQQIECCLCLGETACLVLEPCGHEAVCDAEACVQGLREHGKCPLCRVRFEVVRDVRDGEAVIESSRSARRLFNVRQKIVGNFVVVFVLFACLVPASAALLLSWMIQLRVPEEQRRSISHWGAVEIAVTSMVVFFGTNIACLGALVVACRRMQRWHLVGYVSVFCLALILPSCAVVLVQRQKSDAQHFVLAGVFQLVAWMIVIPFSVICRGRIHQVCRRLPRCKWVAQWACLMLYFGYIMCETSLHGFPKSMNSGEDSKGDADEPGKQFSDPFGAATLASFFLSLTSLQILVPVLPSMFPEIFPLVAPPA